jgi:hypothetical protein
MGRQSCGMYQAYKPGLGFGKASKFGTACSKSYIIWFLSSIFF